MAKRIKVTRQKRSNVFIMAIAYVITIGGLLGGTFFMATYTIFCAIAPFFLR